MKILFFTEISPFPINGGERIRSYGLIKAFSKLGYQVDAIIGNVDQVNLNIYSLANVRYIQYDTQKQSLIEKIFGTDYFKKKHSVISLFQDSILSSKPDLAFLDYSFIGQYISFFKKLNIPVIYGTHNSQSDLTKQIPRKNLLSKLRKYEVVMLQQLHEKLFFPRADCLITVSEPDKNFHAKYLNKNRIQVIPNFLDESRYQKLFEKEDYFIMTANFGPYMNAEGLKWFLTKVWDKELDSKCKLLLVGKESKETFAIIPEAKKFTNIFAIGKVDDITPYIGKAKAVIIPLLHGSGSRLKCLEAMALKTPIIGTSIGLEGIQCDQFQIADTPIEFKIKLLTYKYHPNIGEDLYNDFIKHYSLSNNMIKLDLIIKNLMQNISK